MHVEERAYFKFYKERKEKSLALALLTAAQAQGATVKEVETAAEIIKNLISAREEEMKLSTGSGELLGYAETTFDKL